VPLSLPSTPPVHCLLLPFPLLLFCPVPEARCTISQVVSVAVPTRSCSPSGLAPCLSFLYSAAFIPNDHIPAFHFTFLCDVFPACTLCIHLHYICIYIGPPQPLREDRPLLVRRPRPSLGSGLLRGMVVTTAAPWPSACSPWSLPGGTSAPPSPSMRPSFAWPPARPTACACGG
jgi:hypothetical protein